ncbi:FliI/YscN family ATPase [Piscinibacter terrae]|uniref:FliI/YscN family ATPase n=1 Tax=Piscinibacter terrae TaxID=2496871 RepID=A0A3N7HGX1_9BURK|nr:FliI/YscN family ATPase [Albitalea terrae]RQP21267.1 FliI/YscN family ATPase [Albitalea terrae]
MSALFDDTPRATHAAADLIGSLRHARPIAERGRIVQAFGTTLRVSGLSARIGQQCLITDGRGASLRAQVVGLSHGDALLVPLAGLNDVAIDAQVEIVSDSPLMPCGPTLLGRVLDAFGQPLDGRPLALDDCGLRPVHAGAPNPMSRLPVQQVFATGVRAIDAALTIGEGQRVGVFATAGGGKSTLMGMLARQASSDVNVIALVGERGREVREFIDESLGEQGLARSVVVVATSDRPAMERLRAAQAATAIAEGFRAQGARVLLLMDSVTRTARALREIGLAIGEPAVRRGFPPSVFAELPCLFERAGNDERGSITAFYTVLAEDEDGSDPVAEEVRSILDGHIVLSRELANSGHYPAIDLLASTSRVFGRITEPAHRQAATRLRSLMAKHREIRFLLQVGEYRSGADSLADDAIDRWPAIEALLRQPPDEATAFGDTLARLKEVAG